MQLTGAQMVCESLIREGVDLMFGLPGGAILPFYQTLPEYPQLRHVLVRHEQNAGHAADGYARASGKVGVAIATSGPGATNLVTPLATAMMDSVPIVAITGQVPRAAIGRDAFQETDTTGITMPVTKHNYLVLQTSDIPRIIKEAFHIARSGRPGPVLIDLPRDVLTEVAEFDYPEEVNLPSYRPTLEGHGQMIKRAARLISSAQRPLLLVGHGVIISNATAEVLEVAEKAQIPVITTLLGISGFSGEHVLSLGMPGMHGQAYNNWAIDRADLIIGVGMRFDDRVTGKISAFAPNAQVIHIDIDPAEVGKNVRVTVPIVGDAKRVMHALAKQVEQVSRPEWLAEIDALRREHPLRTGGERARTARGHPRAVRRDGRARNRGYGRGPAPDVGGAALRVQGGRFVDHVRRPRDDGVRGARSDGGSPGTSRPAGLEHRGRRGLPDDDVRTRDDGRASGSGEDRGLQQRPSRPRASTAGSVLWRRPRGFRLQRES